NRLNGSIENIYVWKDQAARLSTKAIEEAYVKMPLSREEIGQLEQGFYVLKQNDIDFAQQHKNLFWERILPDSSERNTTLQARTKAGYTNAISTLRAGKKIFIAYSSAIKKVNSTYADFFKKINRLAEVTHTTVPPEFIKMAPIKILEEMELAKGEIKVLSGLDLSEIDRFDNYPASIQKYFAESLKKIFPLKENLTQQTNKLEKEIKQTIKEEPQIFSKEYLDVPISEAMDKGFYSLREEDKKIMRTTNDRVGAIVLQRIYKHIGSSDTNTTKQARKACAYPTDSLYSDELSKGRVFVVTESALGGVGWKYNDSPNNVVKVIPRIDINYINKIKIMIYYANFLGGNISYFTITSTFRTPEQQADIMINEYFSKNKRGLYGYSEKKYYNTVEDKELGSEEIRKEFARNELIENINSQKSNLPSGKGFPHTNPNYTVIDIDPNSIHSPSHQYLLSSLDKFKGNYIYNYLDQRSGDNAFHIVFQ
ncbi:MAG: hypothetical protein ACRCS8_02175, partial [Brevinema sp.]